MRVLQAQVLPQTGTLVLEDESVRFSTFADAFGGAETEAVRLYTGHPLDAHVVAQGIRSPRPAETFRLRLQHGAVTRVEPD
jgi:hypothetical protein